MAGGRLLEAWGVPFVSGDARGREQLSLETLGCLVLRLFDA